jgi:hypothetical protein
LKAAPSLEGRTQQEDAVAADRVRAQQHMNEHVIHNETGSSPSRQRGQVAVDLVKRRDLHSRTDIDANDETVQVINKVLPPHTN